jgi:hypothetical protein
LTDIESIEAASFAVISSLGSITSKLQRLLSS